MKQQFLDEMYYWILKDYNELNTKSLNEQQRKNVVSNILHHIQSVKDVMDAYRIFNNQGILSDKTYYKYQAMADDFFKRVCKIYVEVVELQKELHSQ